MPYLTGLYAELIDVGPDDGCVVGLTAFDIADGHLDLPRIHRPSADDHVAVTRWVWDGTTTDAGHYRFRRTVPVDRRTTHYTPQRRD